MRDIKDVKASNVHITPDKIRAVECVSIPITSAKGAVRRQKMNTTCRHAFSLKILFSAIMYITFLSL